MSAAVVVILGPEGAGKTTLVESLKLVARPDYRRLRISSFSVSTTSGQELETIDIAPPEQEQLPGQAPAAATAIQLKEVGGRIMPSWPKFLPAKTPVNLIFVVDASSPQQLPTAVSAFMDLLSRTDISPLVRCLLVFNKVQAPGAMKTDALMGFFALNAIRQHHPDPPIVVESVDTFTGLGVEAVYSWIQHC